MLFVVKRSLYNEKQNEESGLPGVCENLRRKLSNHLKKDEPGHRSEKKRLNTTQQNLRVRKTEESRENQREN